jgi:hypothetical protein
MRGGIRFQTSTVVFSQCVTVHMHRSAREQARENTSRLIIKTLNVYLPMIGR